MVLGPATDIPHIEEGRYMGEQKSLFCTMYEASAVFFWSFKFGSCARCDRWPRCSHVQEWYCCLLEEVLLGLRSMNSDCDIVIISTC